MKVKVCGITVMEQAMQLADAEADYLGFIFYPRSARYVIGKIPASSLKMLPDSIKRVGVFVDESPQVVLQIAQEYSLDYVQLHGSEDVDTCAFLRQYIKVIKAFNLFSGTIVQDIITNYIDCCDYFLFDTGGTLPGGNGKKFDWTVLLNQKINTPYLLSGGITATDVSAIKAFAEGAINKPLAVDINSGFETVPGIKNVEQIHTFIRELKNI